MYNNTPHLNTFMRGNRQAILAASITTRVMGGALTDQLQQDQHKHDITEGEVTATIETLALARAFALITNDNAPREHRNGALQLVSEFIKREAPTEFDAIMGELGFKPRPEIESEDEVPVA